MAEATTNMKAYFFMRCLFVCFLWAGLSDFESLLQPGDSLLLFSLIPVSVKCTTADILVHARHFGNRRDVFNSYPHAQSRRPFWPRIIEHHRCPANKSPTFQIYKLRRLNHSARTIRGVNNQNLTFKFHIYLKDLTVGRATEVLGHVHWGDFKSGFSSCPARSRLPSAQR